MLIYKRYGVNINGLICDSMLAAHILKPEARSYKLDNLSIEYLNYKNNEQKQKLYFMWLGVLY